MLFNLENFFLSNSHFPRSSLKPPEKIIQIKKIFDEVEPDIAILLEIGGSESLEQFNNEYLGKNYCPFLLPGNSDRGIELGHLIHKKFLEKNQLKVSHFSHKERTISHHYPNEKLKQTLPPTLSRDIAEIRLTHPQTTNPALIILSVHLKSKWDREGNDFNGILRRTAELKTLVEVYLQRQKEFPMTPIIVAGDFNGEAKREQCGPEFVELYQQTELNDILTFCSQNLQDSNTYYQFTKDQKRQGYQLDYIFLPPILKMTVAPEKSGIYRFKNAPNSILPPPVSNFDRARFPSDHYPLIAHLNYL